MRGILPGPLARLTGSRRAARSRLRDVLLADRAAREAERERELPRPRPVEPGRRRPEPEVVEPEIVRGPRFDEEPRGPKRNRPLQAVYHLPGYGDRIAGVARSDPRHGVEAAVYAMVQLLPEDEWFLDPDRFPESRWCEMPVSAGVTCRVMRRGFDLAVKNPPRGAEPGHYRRL
jgi:hypothetical protein